MAELRKPVSSRQDTVPELEVCTADVAVSRPPGVVVLLSGPEAGKTHLLHTSAVIGRDDDCEIRIDKSDVSRKHAAIELRSTGELVLRDLASRNGTYINGVAVTEQVLKFGDQIGIGATATLLFAHFEPVSHEMQQQQRIESLGRLAGGVAHDFNNMLTVILGGLGFILDLPETSTLADDDIRECLADAIAAAKKSSELTAQLLSFARGHNRTAMAKIDLAEIAEDVLRIAQRTFGSSIKIERSIGRDLSMIGDRSQLTQVLMNLCLNARDAMPKGGTLSVLAARTRTSTSAPPSLVLSIKDTGVGMDEKTKAHAFDPFFTTKPNGQGTGLGLAIVDGILKNHGGTIDLESSPGQGALFTIHLPLMNRSEDELDAASKRGPSTMEKRKGAVLIVDDEDLQLRATRRLVEGLGHTAIVAQDRARAIELFRERRSEIVTVLLDLVMPDGGGEAVLGDLKTIDPQVRVLACSGYSTPERTSRMLDLGARGFLQKPYDRHALQVALLEAASTS